MKIPAIMDTSVKTAIASDSAAEPLYARIYSILHRAIDAGRLVPGTVLLEGPMAEVFGASRAPVRQALAQLHEDGLLRRFEGRGHVVGRVEAPIRRIPLDPALFELDGDSPLLRKSFAWESIYEVVERAIIYRSAFGRARVNELELARHFAVGRAVARDVLTRLEGLGMLEKDERQRWTIVPLDAKRLSDLYEVRRQLEPLALRRAAAGTPRERLLAMRGRLVAQLAAYPNVDAVTMDSLETDLHVGLIAPCGNPELLIALARTRCVLTLSKHVLGVEMELPVYEPFMAEHLAVVDALLAGDAEAAARLLDRHLALSCPKVILRLESFRASYRPPDLSFVG